jgi:mTERF
LEDTLQVMQDFGLSGKDISAILTHSPSLALMMPKTSFLEQEGDSSDSTMRTGETLEETLERSFHGLLLNTLGLRKYDARKVLRTCPGLLSVRGSKSAEQIMVMMSKLGVSEASVARDKASLPTLLSRSPAGLFRLASFLCSSSVRMPIDQVGPLLRRKQSRELMDAVIPIPATSVIETTDQNTGFDMENGVLSDDDPIAEAAIWSRTREERKRNVEELYRNMTKTAFALRNEIGTEDLGRVISAYPNVLLLDVDRQILPVAEYLMEELGILKGDLARVLQLYPMLLGMEIAEMEVVVGYLLALGVEEEDLPSIFRAFPALLTMKPQDMQPVVDYLRSIGVEDIGTFVTRLPPVLGYSVEKELKPKWEFLKVVCMFASFEINKFPAYFSYPLERVIRTRYEYLSHKGISRQLIPVDSVLRYGDKDFTAKVARDEDDGEMFRTFCTNRSKKVRGEKSPKKSQSRKKRDQPIQSSLQSEEQDLES